MSKRVPRLRSDEEAEALLEKDLGDYLNADHMVPLRYEFEAKNKAVNLRLSEGLLEAVKQKAKHQNMPYQRFIRMVLEQAINKNSTPKPE